jgi:uncharacterized delta-60 repeat protein
MDYYTAKYAAADGVLLWEQPHNSPANIYDFAHPTGMAVDDRGNVVVTGYPYTAKYAAADGALLWQRSNEWASAVAVDSSGNVLVTGTYIDYYTAKYAAADGALLWEYNAPPNAGVYPVALAVDTRGNAVVTGSSYTGTHYDYYTAKHTSADGALLWEQRYDSPGSANNSARALAVDSSGNVLVTGFSNNETNESCNTIKYAAADGELVWVQHYNGPAIYAEPSAVAVDSSGSVFVTGTSDDGGRDSHYYTVKYASTNGALLWENRYHGPANGYDEAVAAAVDDSGNVVVTGTSDNGTDSDYYTVKYASDDGALLWGERYNGVAATTDQPRAVAIDENGNVLVTGSWFYGRTSGYTSGYYTAKYASLDGALLWERPNNFQVDGFNGPSAMAVDGSGNVVVTGTFYNGTNYDYYTAKYAGVDGAPLWEKRYDGPAHGNDYAAALAVDGGGSVVVTGSAFSGAGGMDAYTAKYAAADGSLLWEKRHHGAANSYDEAVAVAVDGNGNVVVTGSSYNGTNDDYYTAKYAAADGALLWENYYNGSANRYDYAAALAVDGNNNVLVTGSSDNETDSDYYTAKYAAADGALLWEKRYNSPGSGDDDAQALAVDYSGNVVVTGVSYNGTNTSLNTVKYAAADGSTMWEQHYNSYKRPFPGYESSALAVDISGNVVVSWTSINGTNNDYYTAKYAAADGELLWEKHYDGPGGTDDWVHTSHCLALGPNGMVAVTGTSGNDYATVVYRENLPPISLDMVPSGVRVRFASAPGRTYNIERAASLTGPWITIATPIPPPNGVIEYIDANPASAHAFYRTSAPSDLVDCLQRNVATEHPRPFPRDFPVY